MFGITFSTHQKISGGSFGTHYENTKVESKFEADVWIPKHAKTTDVSTKRFLLRSEESETWEPMSKKMIEKTQWSRVGHETNEPEKQYLNNFTANCLNANQVNFSEFKTIKKITTNYFVDVNPKKLVLHLAIFSLAALWLYKKL